MCICLYVYHWDASCTCIYMYMFICISHTCFFYENASLLYLGIYIAHMFTCISHTEVYVYTHHLTNASSYMYVYIYTRRYIRSWICVYVHHSPEVASTRDIATGCLRLVRLIKSWVSFAKEPYKRDNILQKRPKILTIPLAVATP